MAVTHSERRILGSAHSQRAGLINPHRPNQSDAHHLSSGCMPPSRMLQRYTEEDEKVGRKALSSPEDSARLRMFAYCSKVHRLCFVACLDALKSTQAWPGCFSLASRFRFSFAFDFSCATLFDRISLQNQSFCLRGPHWLAEAFSFRQG